MQLHRKRLVIHLRKFANQITAEIQCGAVLLILGVIRPWHIYQIEQISESTLKTLSQEDQFTRLRPQDVLFAHFDLLLCIYIHLYGNLHHRLHYV